MRIVADGLRHSSWVSTTTFQKLWTKKDRGGIERWVGVSQGGVSEENTGLGLDQSENFLFFSSVPTLLLLN